MLNKISLKELLESGVHFGHKTERFNPKMAEYIFTERNGIHIIDLQKTEQKLNNALLAVSKAAAGGGTVLFVGTKEQAKEIIKEEAEHCGARFVNDCRQTGMFTEYLPDILFVVDPDAERAAADEARRLGIPIIAIVDTNGNPDGIDYVIPGNDDAVCAIKLITGKIADAIIESRKK